MSDGAAWLQPVRSSGGVGAVAQAPAPDDPGFAAGLVPDELGEQAARAVNIKRDAAANATLGRGSRGDMATAYPWIAEGDAVAEG